MTGKGVEMRFWLVALFILVAAPASAHYVAWSDPDFKFTMAFSDLWKDQGGLTGDARIKVAAPGGDGANCIIFAKSDKRFTIYPRDYMLDVVAQEIQWDYWKQALSNSDEQTFYYDNYGALGSGDARYTLVDYIDRNGAEPVRKRALVAATIYGDLHVMTHCSAPIPKFRNYWQEFGRVTDSVQFEQRYASTYRGDYRDFLETKEKGIHFHEKIVSLFWPRKAVSAIVNCPRAGEFVPQYDSLSQTTERWKRFSKDFEECLYKPKPPQIQTR
jgi:hypothetical protein